MGCETFSWEDGDCPATLAFMSADQDAVDGSASRRCEVPDVGISGIGASHDLQFGTIMSGDSMMD